ncbi:MAG: hypothetical protein JSV97_04805, partial [candidate division WOR-3 bacterium]
MRRYFFALGVVVCLSAYSTNHVQSGRPFETARHDINNIEMVITNYGKFGQLETGGGHGLWWPRGSGRGYIYGAGIWFGAIDSVGDTLVTIGHGTSGGLFEFAPGRIGWSIDDPDAIIFLYPETWPSVPPDRLADIFPAKTLSYQDSWCVYNDGDIQYHVSGDTRPIGIEVSQTVYAWNLSANADIIFIKFEIKNVTGDLPEYYPIGPITLTNCWFGVCADADVGDEALTPNDIVSGVVERTYFVDGVTITLNNFCYQWQNEPEPGWDPLYPGAIGFDLLQTPYDIEWGADKDNDGIPDQYERDSSYFITNVLDSLWDADMDGVPDWRDPSQIPQLGMKSLKRLSVDLAPDRDSERYLVMAGYNFVTGQYEPYDTVPSVPDDQRFVQCSGPFDLEPDSSITVLLGIMLADWRTPDGGYIFYTPDSALAWVDNTAQFLYETNWLQPVPPPSPTVTCVPGDARLTLIWDTAPETTPDPYYKDFPPWPPYREYDFEGYGIWKSLDKQEWELVTRCDLYNDIEFDDPETGIYATNTGLRHYYIDTDVRNGFTYYYAVTSFDYNYIWEPDSVRAIWLESARASVASVPRRDPVNYEPGMYVIDILWGNPILADSNVQFLITYPLHMTDEPFYLEFGPIEYDEGYPRYSASLFDADQTIIDSVKITLPEAEQTFHEFGTHNGLSTTAIFRREDIPANTSIFDRVEVSGYPDTLVVLGTMPQNWAYRGNDYELHWIKAYGSDSVNSVVVIDRFVGDTIPFNTGDDSLAQC